MEASMLHDFKKWLREYHEGLFAEYTDMADECWDLDEWMEAFHPEIVADFDDWLVLEEAGRDHYECLEE